MKSFPQIITIGAFSLHSAVTVQKRYALSRQQLKKSVLEMDS
jgi:hypothetical protein